MLRDKLNIIERELKLNSKLDKEKVLTKCINAKLKESLRRYNIQVDWDIYYLDCRNNLQIIKAINKIQKRNNKENILKVISESEKTENE